MGGGDSGSKQLFSTFFLLPRNVLEWIEITDIFLSNLDLRIKIFKYLAKFISRNFFG